MIERFAGHLKLLAPVVVLAAGGAAFALLQLAAPQPGGEETPPLGRLVRAFETESTTHRIAIKAYGTTQAAEEWTAIMEVGGRVQSLHEKLEEGEVLPVGAVIARLDDTDYALAVRRAENDVLVAEQQLLETKQRLTGAKSIITFREQQRDIAQTELDRNERALGTGAITQRAYDNAYSAFLERRTALKDLNNELELLPIQESLREASLESAKLRLTEAQRNLDRCTLALPFAAICLERDIESHQQVAVGQQIGRFLALEKAEVVAMVEPRKSLMLFPNIRKQFGPIDITTGVFATELIRRFDLYKVPVDITWRAGERQSQWRGRAVRGGAIMDQKTRTVPTIVEVPDAFTNIEPGVRPPLVPGMFVELTIYGETVSGVFVLPRECLHGDGVYVVREGRLRIVPVEVLALEEEAAVIDGGLTEGDQVVLTDVFPAADGMRLRVDLVDNPAKPRRELPELRSDLTSSGDANP